MRTAPLVAAAAFLTACAGEPAAETPGDSKLETRWSGGPRDSSVPETGPRLPGPPRSAEAPRSLDPVERAVEDRLFLTDGGRVVLRSIRSQGGWLSWMAARSVQATIQTEGAEPGGSSAVVEVPVLDPPQVPPTPEARRLAAPFWMAAPGLHLEYLGVVADGATGETLDMVDVYGETPGSEWALAYFDRRTGFLRRFLEPPEGPAAEPFRRVDFRDERQAGSLWLAARWDIFLLPDRFSRPDLSKPDLVRVLDVSVVPRAVGLTTGGDAP